MGAGDDSTTDSHFADTQWADRSRRYAPVLILRLASGSLLPGQAIAARLAAQEIGFEKAWVCIQAARVSHVLVLGVPMVPGW